MNKTFIHIASILLTTLLFIGCSNTSQDEKEFDETELDIEYAQGFRLAQGEGYRRIDIMNPWDTTALLRSYILIDKDDSIPQQLPSGTLLRTPLSNTLIFSSVHCSLMRELQCLDAIGGICDSEYVYVEELQQRLATGNLTDAGYSTSPNIEQIIELNPEAILLSPFENTRHERLVNTGIPIIECADYMETSPLGRAEWIRLFGWLYGCEALADSLYNNIKSDYTAIQQRTANIESKPLVITERRIGQVWYVPGGNSYMAHLLSDAGARYPWSDNNNTGSIPLSFENVLERGQSADFWLIKYHANNDLTYQALKEEYTPNSRFNAFEQKHIYGCNTQYIRYYEETPFHPERLLQDLAAIFHPSLFETYIPFYFKALDE